MKNYRKHLPPPPVVRIALTCVFAVSLFSCKITTDEPDTFTVAFNANGGSGSIESITKTENEEFELPANTFTKTGFTFAGWNTKSTPDKSSKSYKDKEKIKLTEDLTLYAQWAAGTGTAYKVEHWQQNIADDGYTLARTEPMTGTTGEKTAAKAEETAGFTAKEFVQEKIAADGSTVVKIRYDRKIITLTFDADNGGDKTTLSGKFGAEIVPPTPEKTGFIFTGWSTDKTPTESSKSYKDKEKITFTEDLTLYAQWKENPSYSINYNLNEGTNPKAARTSYKQEETVVLPVPTREFYDFAGWYLTQDFTGEAITGWNTGEKTGNITLYAKWTAKAENVVNAINNLKEGIHNICVVGEIDETTVKNMGKALRSNENAKVNLDFSGTTGLESIPSWAFKDCTSLTNLKLPASVIYITHAAFYFCTSLTNIEIPTGVTNIDNFAFYGCRSLINIKIPETVTSIGYNAFGSCTSLTDIEIPESVTSIDYSAFESCTSLTDIKLPKNITKIKNHLFYNCRNLTDIEIPENVISIDYSAFYSCTSLTNIEISASVTSIGFFAFDACSNLTTVNYMGTKEQWKSISVDSGNERLTSAKIICTDGVINE